MFENLHEIIKTDENSQAKYAEIKNQFYSEKISMETKSKRRARLVAIALAFFQVLTILTLLYAFKIKTNYENKIDTLEYKISNLESKLERCQ